MVRGSLNPQEVGMAVESIGAAIEVRDVAGDHLLVAADEVAFGEVDGVGELDHLAQEIGACSETFDDPRDLFASGAGAPEIVSGGSFAGSFVVFGDADLGRGLGRAGGRKDVFVGHND